MTRSTAALWLGTACLLLAAAIPLSAAPAKRVLFQVGAVNVNDRWAHFLDPILLMDRGRTLQAPSTLTLNAPARAYERFAQTYYRKGHTYTLLYAGRKAGTVAVQGGMELSCVSLAARVAVSGSARITASEEGLATNDPGLGSAPATRRPPTAGERTAAMTLADRKGDAYQTELASVHVAPHEKARIEEQFIDQVDLDRDGAAEIVTRRLYYKTWDFAVYRRQAGRWSAVYSGGGGGC